MSYARAKVKQGIINLKEHRKGCVSIVCPENNRVHSNTTNGGGGAGGSGSSHTLLPQEAKHIIKRVSTKNTKKKKTILRFLAEAFFNFLLCH